MGKSQKKRAVRRHNPVRVPDSHLPKGLEAAESTSAKKDAVLPIIQKLEGADPQDRIWACSAVSNLIQNDPSTRRLLQGKNIVGALINRLTDSAEEVVVEAAGALRNLCIDGGYDICAEMYNKNILTPLQTFIPKISVALDALLADPKSAPDNARDLVFGFAENVITILWCLSETSNKALNAINQIALAPFLMSFLENRGKLAPRTVAAAGQCLYVLTDDNYPTIEEVRNNSAYTSCLLSIAQTSSPEKEEADERLVTIKALSAGILRNVSPIPLPSAASAVDIDRTVVLPLLTPIISAVNLALAAEQVTNLITQEEEPTVEKLSLKHTPRSDHKTPTERDLERIEGKLRTVQLALEILTGACATLPDPEPEEEEENVSDDEEGEDESPEAESTEMDLDEAPSAPTAPPAPAPRTPAFLPTIIEPLLALIHPTHLSFPPLSATPSAHPPTTSALSAIHIGALECLNNIVLALALAPRAEIAADTMTGRAVWDALWRGLSAVGTETSRGQERRRETWDVAVGVLWGVGTIWRGNIIPDAEQVQVLMQLCNASTDDRVKVKAIGTLECLAQHGESIDANRMIAAYLLSLLPTPTAPSPLSPEPLFQVASALIDIYSDEGIPYDINFRQGGFLDALAGSLAGFKKAVKSIDRKKEGGRELRRRGDEVLENLVGFIAYRRKLRF